jgi:FeS assembly SUF system protein
MNPSDMFSGFGNPPGQEYTAIAGTPLPADAGPVATEAAVIAALETVYDPEIPVNLYELGLIYNLSIAQDGSVDIEMSLTAPGCPVAGEMPGQVAETVAAVPGVGTVEVHLVWEPAWTPERMSADARLALGMF